MNYLGVVFTMKMLHYAVMAVMMISIARSASGLKQALINQLIEQALYNFIINLFYFFIQGRSQQRGL